MTYFAAVVKTTLSTFLVALTALAFGSGSSSITLASSSSPVAAGFTVSGSAGGASGVRDNQDGTYPTFGTSTYTWSATTAVGAPGYTVTSTFTNPTYPSVAYFPNPATVTWLLPAPSGPGPIGEGV